MSLEYLKITPEIMLKISAYDEQQQGRILHALVGYALNGVEPQFDGVEKFVWPTLKQDIDNCSAHVEKQKANGSRGGRPAKQENPEKPSETQNNPDAKEQNPDETLNTNTNTNINTNTNMRKEERAREGAPAAQDNQEHVSETCTREKRMRFTPPAVSETDAFFTENGSTLVEAAKFRAYYESNGWKVGRNPMKDWKAAARGWIARDKGGGFGSQGKSRPASTPTHDPHMQRYTPEERKATYSAAVLDFDE